MGIYYQPPPPFMGAAQPLAPRERTPPSGPAPSNPVFGAVSLLSTLVAAWAASAQPLPPRPNFIPPAVSAPVPAVQAASQEIILAAWNAALSPGLPQQLEQLVPPISGPTPQAPPVGAGARVSEAVLLAWLPPQPFPPQAINLDPPIAGAAPQNPPFSGAQIPEAVLVDWLPPPPAPQWAINLDPPQSGPAPQAPPLVLRQPAIDIAWAAGALVYQPRPLVAALFQQPGTSPPSVGQFPALEAWWTQPGWGSPLPKYLTPPQSGIAPSTPPAGNIVPEAVFVAWLPPPSRPIVAINLDPPQSGPSPQNPPFGSRRILALELWSTSILQAPGSPGVAALVQIISAPPYLSTSTLIAIENWWNQVQSAPQLARLLTPPISGPSNPPFAGAEYNPAIAAWWAQTPPAAILAQLLNPPIGAPQNPPFMGGAQLPKALTAWWPHDIPPPLLARMLNPPLSAPQNPPFAGGAQVPQAVEFWWLPPPPAPQVAILLNPPIGGPLPSLPPPLIDPTRIARAAWDADQRSLFYRPAAGIIVARLTGFGRPGSLISPRGISRVLAPLDASRIAGGRMDLGDFRKPLAVGEVDARAFDFTKILAGETPINPRVIVTWLGGAPGTGDPSPQNLVTEVSLTTTWTEYVGPLNTQATETGQFLEVFLGPPPAGAAGGRYLVQGLVDTATRSALSISARQLCTPT